MNWAEGYGIVANPDIFSDGFIPDRILARDVQIRELQFCLSPILKRRKPIHAWLYGRSGTGKTTIAKYLLGKIQSEAHVRGTYVNCWEKNTFYAILQEILNNLRVLCTEERNTGLKLEEVRKHINDDFFILILDEIDTLPLKERNTTLYNLCNVGNIALICIGESQFPLLALEDRVRSRLNPQIIDFPQYASDDLVRILRQRAEMGLAPDAWSHKILERIAELCEREARIAIYTLRSAANLAESDYSRFIENKHIEKGFNNIKDLKRVYALKSLTEHHQILYHLIREWRGIISKELWNRYLERCKEEKHVPVAKRTFDHYLSQLVRLRLIESKRARVRGKVHLFKVLS